MQYSTEYLYGIQPITLNCLLYPEALQFKVDAARALIGKLIEPHYSKRDEERLAAVIRAEKFNLKLLEELK